jgi:hypothetical protein
MHFVRPWRGHNGTLISTIIIGDIFLRKKKVHCFIDLAMNFFLSFFRPNKPVFIANRKKREEAKRKNLSPTTLSLMPFSWCIYLLCARLHHASNALRFSESFFSCISSVLV